MKGEEGKQKKYYNKSRRKRNREED